VAAGQHTFLFCDLVGFTGLTATEGDDRAAEIALALHDHARQLAPRHRAEEIKTIGDAVMLRGDEPALAVELGLCIVDELELVPGFPPVRAGLHTGPAVSRGRDWYGTTVNVAARLCAAAGGGEVLVSEATSDAAGRMGKVKLSERRLHWLKNVTEPIGARPANRRSCVLSRGRGSRASTTLLAARLEEVHP
jgi:adenylate cyclase